MPADCLGSTVSGHARQDDRTAADSWDTGRDTRSGHGQAEQMESFAGWGAAHAAYNSSVPRIETAKAKFDTAKKQAATAPAASPVLDNVISIDDFSKVMLKTAKVLSAERVEGADKLLKLQVRVGNEERQIVAGIAKYYSSEELLGKTIVIVANLKARELRGLTSYGMLLAAKTGEQLTLITTDKAIASGANVG